GPSTTACHAVPGSVRSASSSSSSVHQLSKDVLQDAAVPEVVRLGGGVDPYLSGEGDVVGLHRHLARQVVVDPETGQAGDRERLLSGQPEALGVLPVAALQ